MSIILFFILNIICFALCFLVLRLFVNKLTKYFGFSNKIKEVGTISSFMFLCFSMLITMVVSFVVFLTLFGSLKAYGNDKLNSTYHHTLEVLNGTEVLRFNDNFSYDLIAPFKVSETFLKETKMDSNTCLIVGDRPNIIENAINNHIGLIILIDNYY